MTDAAAPDFSSFTPAAAPAASPADFTPVDVGGLVRAEADRQGVDPDFAYAIGHQESRFNPQAKSPKGAFGVMQLMPATARTLGVNRYSLDGNIQGGVTYIKQLLDEFKGDKRLAAAAYNAGPNAVHRYGDVPPYAETQDYVEKVLGKDAAQGAQPDFAGFTPAPAPAAPASDQPDFSSFTPAVQPPSLLERLGKALQGQGDGQRAALAAAPGQLAQAGDAVASVFPKGNPNSPIASWLGEVKDAEAARGHDAADAIGAGFRQIGEQGEFANPGHEPITQNANLLGGLNNVAGGVFGGLAAWPGALIDATGGKALHAATGGRIPASVVGDAMTNAGAFLLDPATAIKPGVGTAIDAHTGFPLTQGQEAFYANWDRTQPPPMAQIHPEDVPAPGQSYVDMQGKLQTVPDVSAPASDLAPEEVAVGPHVAAAPEATPPHDWANLGPEQVPTPAPEPVPPEPEIPDTRGQGVQYHGARGPIDKLEDEGYYSPDNIYGGQDTFYTTDAADVAKGYGRKNPNALIYEAHERQPVKMFDMEQPLDEGELNRLFGVGPDDFGLVPMAIDGALEGGRANLRSVMDEIRGESRNEGYSKNDVQDEFDVAIQRLQQDGYGGMQHVGGLKTNRPAHTVKIYFRPGSDLELRPSQFGRPSEPAAAPDFSTFTPADLEPPFDAKPTSPPSAATLAGPAQHVDMINQALDALRDDKNSKPMNGPRLSDMIIKNGGLKPSSGDVGALELKGYGGRGGRMLSEKNGMSVERAAELAQEQGFIGKPIADDADLAGPHTYADPQELLEAIRSDMNGDHVHSSFHEPRADAVVKNLMRDLHEELAIHDIDLDQPNDVIRAKLQEGWDAREAEATRAYHAERADLDPGHAVPDHESEAAYYGAREPADREGEFVAPLAADIGRTGRIQAAMEPADGEAPLAVRPGQLLGLRDKPVGQAIGRADPATPEPLPKAQTRVSGLVTRLKTLMDSTLRQGRMTLKGDAVGQWAPLTGVARTKAWGEMDYASHELGHDLNFKATMPSVKAAVDAHAQELIPLDYIHDRAGAAGAQARASAEASFAKANPKATPKDITKAGDAAFKRAARKANEIAKGEGFAEFFRRYVTGGPDVARAAAPKFFKAFETAMAKDNPAMLKGVQGVSGDYVARMAAPAADRMVASVVSTVTPRGPLAKFMANAKVVGTGEALKAGLVHIYGDLVGSEAEFGRAIRGMQRVHWENTGKALDLNGRANPLVIFRTMRVAAADGFANMFHGIRKADETRGAGPSLRGALETAYGKDWSHATQKDFSAYLITRRLIDEWDRYAAGKLPNPPFRESRAALVQALADFEAAHPTFRQGADQFSDYAHAEMGLDLEAGLITQQAHDAAIAERPFYAPLNRVREEGPGIGHNGAPEDDVGANSGGMQQTKGSLRDFLDPVEVMMRRAMTQATVRRFNMGVRSMKALADHVGRGAGKWVEEVPDKEIKAYATSMEEVLQKTAEKYGVDPEDLRDLWQAADIDVQPDDKLTFFKAQGTKARGEPMVFYWEDGVRHAIRLQDGEGGALMLEFMSGLSKQTQTALGAGAAAITKMLRLGVTTAPAWALANAIKDALDVWLKVPGALPGVTLVSGLKEILTNSETAQEYERFGRIKGGVIADAFEHARKTASPDTLQKHGMLTRHFVSLAALARLVEFSELGTRVGVYKLAKSQATKRGMAPIDAVYEASNVAADYMPFDRVGRKTAAARQWVAFANAWAQGLDATMRTAVPGTALYKLKTGEALTVADKQALYTSGRYWALVSTLPVAISLWQHSIYHDDPDYQEINAYRRAANWVVKAEDLGVPKSWEQWTGKWIDIPKPFEHVVLANAAERVAEHVEDGTPTKETLGQIGDAIWQQAGPPNGIAFISPYMEIQKNRNFNGQPIIPDSLMGAGDNELKVNSYTSDLSKALSHQVGNLTEAVTGQRRTFSPAQADFWVTTLAGTQGRDFMSESNRVMATLHGKQQPTLGPEDDLGTSRFVFDPSRASQSNTDFWARVGKDGGTYNGAVQNFQILQQDHPGQAIAGLAKLAPDVRDYVLAEKFGEDVAGKVPGGASMLHPMVRAEKMVTVLSDLRKDIREGTMADEDGAIKLTPDQRKLADTALSHLEDGEVRDALILSGAPAYAKKAPMDLDKDRSRLAAINPRLLTRLDGEAESRHILPYDEVRDGWPEFRANLRDLAGSDLSDAVERDAERGTRGKYDELIRQNKEILDTPD